ncbi:MAG: erythromycin esterase family protein [Chitinophagaceae bacterium]
MRHFLVCFFLGSTVVSAAQQLPDSATNMVVKRNESKEFTFSLKKGYVLKATVMQKGIDVEVIIHKATDTARLFYKDSPNGDSGPEPVVFESPVTATYVLVVRPFIENVVDQGIFSIRKDAVLSPAAMKKEAVIRQQEETDFVQWLTANSSTIKYVDPGNEFADLQPLKTILKEVQVVGLGESSHGTSEFFRMKHRLLEFLVIEMGYRSFYIEASMSRCRYVNEYVLYGKGDLDTATVMQGFITWRVEEFRNMLQWMRQYNSSVTEERKVKFVGYDLQVNDQAWKELSAFYKIIKPSFSTQLDSMEKQSQQASNLSNNFADSLQQKGRQLYRALNKECSALLQELVMNAGQYQLLTNEALYHRNWQNLRLIIQETETFMETFNSNRRDYYMAENILELLQNEPAGTKVVVWAHNAHISKVNTPVYHTMGHWLDSVLKKKYYALGFEFYSGNFQTRNLDTRNWSRDWDVMSSGEPTARSLPWYLDKTGKENLLLDLRNTGMEKIKLAATDLDMHSFGSMYSVSQPAMFPGSLSVFDGILYIKRSTAAKNFKKFYL